MRNLLSVSLSATREEKRRYEKREDKKKRAKYAWAHLALKRLVDRPRGIAQTRVQIPLALLSALGIVKLS